MAEDLIRRKITSPAHLGIQGGSNGGLLVGNLLTRRPELFRRGGLSGSVARHEAISQAACRS